MKISRAFLLDAVSVVTGLAAVAVAVAVLTSRSGPTVVVHDDLEVEDWERFAAAGNRIGPEEATVTVTVWFDYECPTCKTLHNNLMEYAQTEREADVALVFRHWPLDYHQYSYPAARATECAADQGSFELFQTRLFETDTNPSTI